MPDKNLTTITNQLSSTLDVQQITPDYFLTHYAEFIPRVIAKGNPSSDTMRHYCNQIDFFIRWCIAHERHPLAMNEYQIMMYREFLLNRQYKPDSIQVMLAAVRAFYTAAKKIDLIKVNPAADVEAPSVGNSTNALLHFYTPQQMNEIIYIFDEDTDDFTRTRNKLILYLMGVEGLRNIEVHRACVEDINWEANAIMVRGKGTKGRMEPIYPCEETFELIKEYLKAIPTDHAIKKDGVLTPLILSSSNRNFMGRISRNGIRSIMNKALEACDLKHPGYSCHVFRHSCGTNLYQETKDLRLVQDILRHRDPKVTARYAHVADRLSKRYTSKLVPHD
ncbi:putative recombinase (plasmid) [Selenomonas ruminantium subsp. lactilytica TAM6421]|uniref:Putative recombinase n=1 Tax=Selenomonas ruminantium subsp. lactilytica (strain NBRC 103574 / TAM6421) TaxID=927704 RepID=I0GW63_SELRL|nr:tyrosine-type recombinase/integrase [Selenomonas ruminantium]BAL85000.1 putative recombinase [Selenomonas ruminantium subsp. lactilytica TAM6421]